MPNQRADNKDKLSVWVQDIEEIDEYCKRTGKNRTEVIQELIRDLKKKRQQGKK
jgi:metal-responsive CopG/Arc/MetJ family transcriptional regulator